MIIDFLLEGFQRQADCEALVWGNQSYTYKHLLNEVSKSIDLIAENNIEPGEVVIVEADYSPSAVAIFLALIKSRCIVVPLTSSVSGKRLEFLQICRAQKGIVVDANDKVDVTTLESRADHEYYQILRQKEHPGLVLFSSGSSGKSKAAVHDIFLLLEKFHVPRRAFRTIPFLLYDHIGGINTLLYTLANGGCLITVADRSPDAVLSTVERHKVELLPTSPTFLNLVILSEAYKRHDLSSLKMITYGTEPMPLATLTKCHQIFPTVELLQTYGLSELGILRSKSKSSDSLWVKIGGQGYETRVIDGLLQIRAKAAMLGYLNAASPFTDDGWFITGDRVEVDGDYFRFLGRASELINVGGEKVYPAEVESTIMELDNIAEVTVYSEANAITGSIVCARVRVCHEEERAGLSQRIKVHCSTKLAPYKVPVKILFDTDKQHGARFKKNRLIQPH